MENNYSRRGESGFPTGEWTKHETTEIAAMMSEMAPKAAQKRCPTLNYFSFSKRPTVST